MENLSFAIELWTRILNLNFGFKFEFKFGSKFWIKMWNLNFEPEIRTYTLNLNFELFLILF